MIPAAAYATMFPAMFATTSFRVSLAACSSRMALTQALIIVSYLANVYVNFLFELTSPMLATTRYMEPALRQASWSITDNETTIVGLSETRRLTGK